MNLKKILKKKKPSRKQTAKNVAIGAGIGTAVGVAAGVLLAPKSGKETRGVLTKKTKDTLETVKDGLSVAKDKIEEIVKKEKEAIFGKKVEEKTEEAGTDEIAAEEDLETVEEVKAE